MASTDDPEELETYRQKEKEYKMALYLLKQNETDAELHSDGSPQQEQESLCKEEEAEIAMLRKKLRKADKSLAKARKEEDPKVLKMEKKRAEYQNALDKLLTKS